MSDSPNEQRNAGELSSRYRVHALHEAEPTERGVLYRDGGSIYILDWERVERALAADVGEPEGVRTIVFDLVTSLDGEGCRACRLDAQPGEEAMAVARFIRDGLGDKRCTPSVESLAVDGVPTRWYPDLGSLAEANHEALRSG